MNYQKQPSNLEEIVRKDEEVFWQFLNGAQDEEIKQMTK